MSKVVVAIKEIGGVEQKRLLGVFDSTWRIFVETEPGNATEIAPSEHESNAAEFYQCKSYYDNNNQLQDCTCGKCGDKSVITTKEVEEHQKIELPDITATGDWSSETEVTIPMRQRMLDVTNWINSQEEK